MLLSQLLLPVVSSRWMNRPGFIEGSVLIR
jgi:hypothetical protein